MDVRIYGSCRFPLQIDVLNGLEPFCQGLLLYVALLHDLLNAWVFSLTYLFIFLIVEAGVPHLKWFGVEGEHNVMVIDLLGPSLEDLFNYCNRKFSLKTVLMLADQMVSIFDFLSEYHYLFAPEFFMLNLLSAQQG